MQIELIELQGVIRWLYPRADFKGDASYAEDGLLRIGHRGKATFYVEGPHTGGGRQRPSYMRYSTTYSEWTEAGSLDEVVQAIQELWGQP